MRPEDADQTLGRFIACRAGFLDPEVFARGRELTLTGTVEALEQRNVGEFSYQYPIVRAGFITMWPERQEVIIQDYDMFYSPWYWNYPYYGYPYPYHNRPQPRSYDKGPRVDVPADTKRENPNR
jgi:outer membrane lipoprotein